MPPSPDKLPIDDHLPAILAAVQDSPRLLLSAEPGAGKTTRVPAALLKAPFAAGREVWVLEPRRLAARLPAERVAFELGEPLGGLVGYQFRFERALSPATRLRFITEGMLPRLAREDPSLARVACVVLDEFHERSAAADLALALLRRLQAGPRPDLRLVLMSATLDEAALAAALAPCRQLRCPGRQHPVACENLDLSAEPRLEQRVLQAAGLLAQRGALGADGAALAFLPGRREIEAAARALAPLARQQGWELKRLHGSLPPSEQRAALLPGPKPRLILCTNIAETSLTVPGVRAVIDSGLVRKARASAWSGLSRLATQAAPLASLDQRAGRAGRLGPGLCLRLFPRWDQEQRARFEAPELLASDLSPMLLSLLDMGLDPAGLAWLDAPAPAAWAQAASLLAQLGACDATGSLTPLGRAMAAWPLHPRLARLLEACRAQRVPAGWAGRLAALLSEERAEGADLWQSLKRYQPAGEAAKVASLVERELKAGPGALDEQALGQALLLAYPDRVALARGLGPQASRGGAAACELLLAGGGTAILGQAELPAGGPYFLVLDAAEKPREARGGQRSAAQVQARLLAPVAVEQLLGVPSWAREEDQVAFDARLERLQGQSQLRYGALVLEESRLKPEALRQGPRAQALLKEAARAAGPEAFCAAGALDALRGRWRFLERALGPGWPAWDEQSLLKGLDALAEGRLSFEEMRAAGLMHGLRARLGQAAFARLDALAPERLRLASGRQLAIHYGEGREPWAASRLQDFFGMRQAPSLAEGRASLTLELLAPSGRPVQVTSDLAGFWQRHYPGLRQELMRRYPRHAWPEDPMSAPAPRRERP
jgi:ATP-dependent helicase HrpB